MTCGGASEFNAYHQNLERRQMMYFVNEQSHSGMALLKTEKKVMLLLLLLLEIK